MDCLLHIYPELNRYPIILYREGSFKIKEKDEKNSELTSIRISFIHWYEDKKLFLQTRKA